MSFYLMFLERGILDTDGHISEENLRVGIFCLQ